MSATPRNFRPSISEGSALLEARRPRSNPKSKIQNLKSPSAFTLIELLVALVLAAALLTVAVMIYQSLTASDSTRPSFGAVTLGPAYQTFYGVSGTVVPNVFFAPSYGRAAQAEIVRSEFIDDLQRASAVYCLGRNGVNSFRAHTISISSSFRGASFDTPDAFRALIDPTAATFVSYRGASTATNASIFILSPADAPRPATSTSPEILPTLSVRAIYDIDLTPTTSPAGTYVSVKRYGIVATTESSGLLGSVPTDYYDVFYPTPKPTDGATIPFNPLIVCFERAARAAAVEGDTIDRFKRAAERPFYFVWWPDPTAHTLEALSASSPYGAADPRAAYFAMGARTAFFLVVPMFPSL